MSSSGLYATEAMLHDASPAMRVILSPRYESVSFGVLRASTNYSSWHSRVRGTCSLCLSTVLVTAFCSVVMPALPKLSTISEREKLSFTTGARLGSCIVFDVTTNTTCGGCVRGSKSDATDASTSILILIDYEELLMSFFRYLGSIR